jgi:hypothetical protein
MGDQAKGPIQLEEGWRQLETILIRPLEKFLDNDCIME